MKLIAIILSLVSTLLYMLCMITYKTESMKLAFITLVALALTFAVLCISMRSQREVPEADDVLETETENIILGVFPEKECILLVTKEVPDPDFNDNDGPHFAIKIRNNGNIPEVGTLFHVDKFGHIFIDGTRAEVKEIMSMSAC